jgi:dTMP kinase
LNRMDNLDLEFHRRVREGYLKLLDAEPSRWVKIDASQDVDSVQTVINSVVMERLNLVRKPE